MVSDNSVNTYNSDENIDNYDGNSSDTNPPVTLAYYILQRNHS